MQKSKCSKDVPYGEEKAVPDLCLPLLYLPKRGIFAPHVVKRLFQESQRYAERRRVES